MHGFITLSDVSHMLKLVLILIQALDYQGREPTSYHVILMIGGPCAILGNPVCFR